MRVEGRRIVKAVMNEKSVNALMEIVDCIYETCHQ
jgi:hypothetical protein